MRCVHCRTETVARSIAVRLGGHRGGRRETYGAGFMTTTGTETEVREEYFESQATGVEVETEVSPPPDEPEPWDPEKIRIHTKHYSLRQLVDMIADSDIDLAPDFQRHYVWKPRAALESHRVAPAGNPTAFVLLQ